LRMPQVLQRTSLSKATIARREAEGLFPARRRLRASGQVVRVRSGHLNCELGGVARGENTPAT